MIVALPGLFSYFFGVCVVLVLGNQLLKIKRCLVFQDYPALSVAG